MRRIWLLIPLLAVCFSSYSRAQIWSGVLARARAVDWSTAGIPGGLPSASWTQCGTTIASGASAATINAALAGTGAGYTGCSTPYYIKLGPGAFTTTSGTNIHWTKSYVALRGSGADQTTISGSGSTTCPGYGYDSMVAICTTDGSGIGGSGSFNWTAGYAKGATALTLNATTGIVANQTLVFLDQCDDGFSGTNCTGSNADTGNYFVCSDGNCDSEGVGTNAYRTKRAQIQIVVPTAVGANSLTIPAPGLHAPQWRSGQSPGAWIMQSIVQAGVEDLTIDTTSSGADGVLMWGAYKGWVSGVKVVLPAAKSAVRLVLSAHCQIQNNYIFGQQTNDPYGIQFQITADDLVVNNIIQQDRSPIVLNGPSSGDVFAYNFTILNVSGSGGNWSFWNHSSGIAYDLWEGNVAAGFANDDIHGTHNMITRFRNRFSGKDNLNTSQVNPNFDAAFNRYSNVIGNVLGDPSLDTLYQADFNNPSNMIHVIGWGNTLPNDSVTVSTIMRWGNYDTVNAAVRFVAGENGSGATTYPGLASPSSTLPASFYYSSTPAWWPAAKVWPPIGPDVASGNIVNTGGHANTIPAQDCFLNVIGGPADGSGSVRSFNAATCYPTSNVNPPVGLSAAVK